MPSHIIWIETVNAGKFKGCASYTTTKEQALATLTDVKALTDTLYTGKDICGDEVTVSSVLIHGKLASLEEFTA